MAGNRKSTSSSGNAAGVNIGRRSLTDQQMRILDENGNDLTPLPMILDDRNLRQADRESTLDPAVFQVSSLQHHGPAFSRSVLSMSNPFSETTSEQSESHTTKRESGVEEHSMKEIVAEPQEPIDLDEPIHIMVTESETFWLFDQQPRFLPNDHEWVAYQTKRNSSYKALCASRLGNDRYVERGMNTMPRPTIVKVVQTFEIEHADKAVNAAACELWDAAQQLAGEESSDEAETTNEVSEHVEDGTDKPRVVEDFKKTLRSTEVPSAIARITLETSNTRQLADGFGEVPVEPSETTFSGNIISSASEDVASIPSASGDSTLEVLQYTERLKSLNIDDPNILGMLKNMEKALNLNSYYEKFIQYKSLILNNLIEEFNSGSDLSEMAPDLSAPPSTAQRMKTTTTKTSLRVPPKYAAAVEDLRRPVSTRRSSTNTPEVGGKRSAASPNTTGVGGPSSDVKPGERKIGEEDGGGGGDDDDDDDDDEGQMEDTSQEGEEHDETGKRGSRGPSEMRKKTETETNVSMRLPSNPHMYMPPDLYLLWKYSCVQTRGRNVAAMAFNSKNKDILAVGYGEFEFDRQQSGLVCCWSLKKVTFPERLFRTPSGVTAVGWSLKNENLLAVGMFSGVIMVFDARKGGKTPIIDTTHATAGRNYGPIVKLEWVTREAGRSAGNSESLVSLSMDGRVTEWFTLKGFDCTDLMVLKRPRIKVANHVIKKSRSEALIVRHAVGTALCFNDQDKSMYIVGAEDGQIHKCSCSYTEQYLNTYHGHTSSVYSLKWAPAMPDVFLSCSADWTMRLWHVDRARSYLTMATHSSAVNDLAWSPKHGAVFACTNESFLEIWDLERSTLDAVHVEMVCVDSTMSIVLFTEDSDTVMVGDSQGNVYVYAMKNFPQVGNPTEESMRLANVLSSCLSSQVPT